MSLARSVHRVLALRTALLAVATCAVFGAIAFVAEKGRLETTVTELAEIQVHRFNQQIRTLLDATTIDSGRLQRALDEFSSSGSVSLRDGRFVLVRIHGPGGEVIGRLSAADYADIALVEQRLDEVEAPQMGRDERRTLSVRLGGSPYVGVAMPLLRSTGIPVARIVGVFAVSDAAVERIRGNVWRTVLYVMAIVALTALVIYPLIGGLMVRLARQTNKLLRANLATLEVLGDAIAKRDSDTDSHNYRVSVYSVRLAEAIDLDRGSIKSLVKGALLHDVGKIGIRDEILLKPARLDPEEFEVMKTHVDHGLDIIGRAAWLEDARGVVGSHHEKFAGGGYPAGLDGDRIPLSARIFAIADVFDALTSERPYKRPMSYQDTMEVLEAGRGSHFDPDLLDAFSKIGNELYTQFGGKDGAEAKNEFKTITERYFRQEFSELLK